MINDQFISKFGEATPYRICYNKNYTGLSGVNSQNGSGFIQIKVPFNYYTIEKTSLQYKLYDAPVTGDLLYCVTEIFYNIVPGSDPLHQMNFAEETGDLTRMKKELPHYSRNGTPSEAFYDNVLFNNASNSIGWEFLFTFGTSVTGELRIWIEISGQYFK